MPRANSAKVETGFAFGLVNKQKARISPRIGGSFMRRAGSPAFTLIPYRTG
jgi:hypothetical protein